MSYKILPMIVATVAGYFTFERFHEIESEARENVESTKRHVAKAQALVGEIKGSRNEAESHVERITALDVRNNPAEARKAAKSVQEDPMASAIDQAVAAAVLLQRQGDIEEAIEKWRAVANVVDGTDKETGARAWFSVGYLLHSGEKDNIETVIDAYDEAIRLKPDYAEAYNNRGVAKNNLGHHEEAIADYDEAIRLKSDYAAAYNNRGIAKNDLGHHEEVIADYDEAIRLKPDYIMAYNNRGKTNALLNRTDKARQDFETAITFARDTGNEGLASDAERALRKLSGEQDP